MRNPMPANFEPKHSHGGKFLMSTIGYLGWFAEGALDQVVTDKSLPI